MRMWERVVLLAAMVRLHVSTARWFELVGGDSDKFSDQTWVAEILRPHFPGDGALLNDEDPLRERGDEVEVLFDQDHGQARVVAQPFQDLDNLIDDRGLDTLGRLIEQDEARLAAKAARDREQLLLAAG